MSDCEKNISQKSTINDRDGKLHLTEYQVFDATQLVNCTPLSKDPRTEKFASCVLSGDTNMVFTHLLLKPGMERYQITFMGGTRETHSGFLRQIEEFLGPAEIQEDIPMQLIPGKIMSGYGWDVKTD